MDINGILGELNSVLTLLLSLDSIKNIAAGHMSEEDKLYIIGDKNTQNKACLCMYFFYLVQFCTGVQGDKRTGLNVPCEVYHLPIPAHTLTKDSHNTGNFMPYIYIVYALFMLGFLE